jgi:uncharacterized protein
MRIPLTLLLLNLAVSSVNAQTVSTSTRPVIDMHMHTWLPDPPDGRDSARAYIRGILAQLDSFQVVLGVMSGPEEELDLWASMASNRVLLAPVFPCDHGLMPDPGVTANPHRSYCFRSRKEFPDTAWLRRQFRSGRFRAMGELTNQYAGVAFDDPRMMPYYALAQEFDVPVAFHTNGSFPLTAQGCCPKFRLRLGDPIQLEDVLVKFPRLRVQIMHGWPSDQLFAMLYQYPQLVVDLSPWAALMPAPAFHALLRKYKDAGYLDRVLFGTDYPNISQAVTAFTSADFLSPAELDGVLCGNAERFLRLSGVCNGSRKQQ